MTNAITSSLKKCFKCGESQPRTNFYKHGQMADGLMGKCKDCTKKDVAAHREKHIEKIRAYDRARGKNKERMAYASEISKRWRAEDSRRMKSHNAVARALKNGVLQKSNCCICGSEKSLAHHESYDRPLDVVWYCQIHHKERHKQMAIDGIEP